MKEKKLIIFIPSIEDGGVEKNLYLIANYVGRNNIKTEILTCNYNKKKNFNEKIKLIGPRSKLFFNKSRKIKYLICLLYLFVYLLRKKSQNLVFAFQANIYAIIVAKLTFTKVITRSNSSPSGWSKNPIKYLFYYIVIRLANGVMVNSYDFKKEFSRKFKINPTCILNPFYRFNLSKKINNIKNKKKYNKNLNILTIGRLTDQKDHVTLVKAAKLLNPLLKPKIKIIGKGVNYNNLKKLIYENNLTNIVKLTGYRDKAYSYIKNTDIFVLTSRYEGLPNVLLEAQYFKKYIISTDCPTGPSEILLNGRAGDLIKMGDHKKLAKLINDFPKNKKKKLKMVKIGFNYLKRYDFNANCMKYLNFINFHF